MKVVYVAGPYRAVNAWEVEKNIRRAEELSLKVWHYGMAAICPHANTRFFDGAEPDELWLRGDLAILAKCDAILLTEDYHKSEGAKKEESEARKIGIPVFYDLDELCDWALFDEDEGDEGYERENADAS